MSHFRSNPGKTNGEYKKSQVNCPLLLFFSLPGALVDHMNAEIVSGTVGTKQEGLDYLTWTYFFRRLVRNPTYYGLDLQETDVNKYLSALVDVTLQRLVESSCIRIEGVIISGGWSVVGNKIYVFV